MAKAVGKFVLDNGGLKVQVREFIRPRAFTIGKKIADSARERVPVRTGELKRSIRDRFPRFSGPFRVKINVEATAPYARWVHDGTDPHVIRAKNSSVLVFRMGDRKVFAKSVNHPGTKPNPFLVDAMEEVVSRL